MTITVTGPDGSTFEFPDGTAQDVVSGALQRHYGAPQAQPEGGDYSMADQLVGAAARGVPVVGPLDTKADAMVDALAHPVTGSGEAGATVGERYERNLAKKTAAAQAFEAEHPVLDTAAGLAGGTLALGSAAGASPAIARGLGLTGKTLPAMGRAAMSGSALGTLDAAARGEDPTAGGVVGALTGAGGVLAGKAIGKGIDAARRIVSRETPQAARFMDVNGVQVPVSESTLSGDPATAAREQIIARGGAGEAAQGIATQANEDTRAAMDRAHAQTLDALAPGATPPASPEEAGRGVVDDLVTQESRRAADEVARLRGASAEHASLSADMNPVVLPQQPGTPVSGVLGAGEAVQGGLQRRAQALAAMRDAAYQALSRVQGEFMPAAFRGASNAIRDSLAGPDRVLVNPSTGTTTRAAQALNLIDTELGQQRFTNAAARGEMVIGADGRPVPRPITPADVEEVRKGLVQLRRDANNAARAPGGSGSDARAVGRIMDAFDQHMRNAVEAGAFTGDGEAYLNAIARARNLHSEFRGNFSKNSAADRVGATIEDIIGRNGGAPMNPGKVIPALVGAPDSPGGGVAHGVAVLQRLRSLLGADSREWASLRKGVLSHLTEAPEGLEAVPYDKQADRVKKFLNAPQSRLHAETLYSPAERARLSSYADRVRRIESPAPATTAEKLIAKWSGRTGEPPASATAVVNGLLDARGGKETAVQLARLLKQNLSPESLGAVKQGLWLKVTKAPDGMIPWGSQKVGQNVHNFLKSELARELYAPNERMLMKAIGDAELKLVPVQGSTNPSNTAPTLAKIARGASNQLLALFGFSHGGLPGAATAIAAGKALGWVGDRRAAKEATQLFLGPQPRRPSTSNGAQRLLATAAPALAIEAQRSK